MLVLHVPDGTGPIAAAILVHGGGFDQGSKSTNVRPLFQPLSDADFAWFSIDYRMAPEFHFTEASADLDTAIEWLKAIRMGRPDGQTPCPASPADINASYIRLSPNGRWLATAAFDMLNHGLVRLAADDEVDSSG